MVCSALAPPLHQPGECNKLPNSQHGRLLLRERAFSELCVNKAKFKLAATTKITGNCSSVVLFNFQKERNPGQPHSQGKLAPDDVSCLPELHQQKGSSNPLLPSSCRATGQPRRLHNPRLHFSALGNSPACSAICTPLPP